MEVPSFGTNKLHILTGKEFIFRNGHLKEHVLCLVSLQRASLEPETMETS